MLGALTVLLALAAWWKQEDWRPVLLAFVLGLTGIAFQGMYMLASAALLVAVVLMALSAAFGSSRTMETGRLATPEALNQPEQAPIEIGPFEQRSCP